MFTTAKRERFVSRGRRLAPKRLEFLPPYSTDFDPIEPCWGLAKKHIRVVAPRTSSVLRRAAHADVGACVRLIAAPSVATPASEVDSSNLWEELNRALIEWIVLLAPGRAGSASRAVQIKA